MGASTHAVDSSHVPTLSQPGFVLDVIRKAAQAVRTPDPRRPPKRWRGEARKPRSLRTRLLSLAFDCFPSVIRPRVAQVSISTLMQ